MDAVANRGERFDVIFMDHTMPIMVCTCITLLAVSYRVSMRMCDVVTREQSQSIFLWYFLESRVLYLPIREAGLRANGAKEEIVRLRLLL